ncbi:MAG: YbaK/EbsC family protein [Thermomicrobiales bacterium]
MSDVTATAPRQLIAFLERHGIEAELLAPGVPMPTVTLAAEAIGVAEDAILKTLIFSEPGGSVVVAIANGNHRIDRNRLAAAVGAPRVKPASADDVLRATGYPAGGVSPLGLPADARVVVDVATAALSEAYGGGGREDLLLHVRIEDIIRLNSATVADIREQTVPTL